MAKEQLVMKATGLATFADVLSKVPEGSLKVASNVVINKDGLVSPRRGFENLDGTDSLGTIHSMHSYKNTIDSYILIHHDTDALSYYTGSSWSEFAQTLNIPSGAERIRAVEYNNNIYFTSNTGVQKLDSVTSPLLDAGAPQAGRISGEVTGTNGWFLKGSAEDTRVAYRAIWGYKDANDVLIVGSPSQREEVVNSYSDAVDTDVALTVYIPRSIINNWHFNRSWFFQVYRSDQVEDTGAGPTTPSDDMQLAYEANPDTITGTLNGGISASATTITVTDGTLFEDTDQVLVIGTEQIHIAGVTGNDLEVADNTSHPTVYGVGETGRGYNNTTASIHATGAEVVSSVDIYNGYVTFTDFQFDALLGADLYTNATQQGILQANDEPPLCRDMALYQNHMFYANTTGKHSVEFRLEGTSLTGISNTLNGAINDAVTSLVLTSAADFPVATSGTASTHYVIQVDDEQMLVTNVATNTLTVTRNHNGTTAAEHLDGATVYYVTEDSLTINDSITIFIRAASADPVATEIALTYTGVVGTTTETDEFEISNTGFPGFDVEVTAKNLVNKINQDPSNDGYVLAIYDSDTGISSSDLPGNIRIVELDYNSTAVGSTDSAGFYVYANTHDDNLARQKRTWTPTLLESDPLDSSAERAPNRLYYSKFQQPEAVPILNYFSVGAANDKILRILPLQAALMIFTEAGIYKLTGTSEASFQVTLMDNTTTLVAPDTAVILNSSVFGFFDQGISQVTTNAVNVLSRAIEGDLLKIRGAVGADIGDAFGIGYESDRKYIMFVRSTSSSTQPDIAYVYNTVTMTWTTYDLSKTAGLLNRADDKVYLSSSNSVVKERKNFTDSDIADEQTDCTVSAVNGNLVTIDHPAALVASVGDMFWETDNKYSIITAVNTTTDVLTLTDDLSWTTGAAEVRKFFKVEVEWNPITCDHPSVLKQFSECTLMFNQPARSFDLSFKTHNSPSLDDVTFVSASDGAWGYFAWGDTDMPWGGEVDIVEYRTYVPRQKQRTTSLVLKFEQDTIYNDFELAGFSLIYRNISSKSEH